MAGAFAAILDPEVTLKMEIVDRGWNAGAQIPDDLTEPPCQSWTVYSQDCFLK